MRRGTFEIGSNEQHHCRHPCGDRVAGRRKTGRIERQPGTNTEAPGRAAAENRTMKALVYHGPRDLRYEEVDTPKPGKGEVLVKVRAVSICGSDLSGYKGGSAMRVPPLVMGHEFSGEIAQLGEGVTGLTPGDRVGVVTNLYCGKCQDCRDGLQNVCDHRYIIGTTMKAGSYNGAMADYVVAPAEKIMPLPGHVSFNECALVEPLSISLRATKHIGKLEGKTVAVFGTGPIGLMGVMCLKAFGAKQIIAVDLLEKRQGDQGPDRRAWCRCRIRCGWRRSHHQHRYRGCKERRHDHPRRHGTAHLRDRVQARRSEGVEAPW
jgi:hypothetical protein